MEAGDFSAAFLAHKHMLKPAAIIRLESPIGTKPQFPQELLTPRQQGSRAASQQIRGCSGEAKGRRGSERGRGEGRRS